MNKLLYFLFFILLTISCKSQIENISIKSIDSICNVIENNSSLKIYTTDGIITNNGKTEDYGNYYFYDSKGILYKYVLEILSDPYIGKTYYFHQKKLIKVIIIKKTKTDKLICNALYYLGVKELIKKNEKNNGCSDLFDFTKNYDDFYLNLSKNIEHKTDEYLLK